MPARPPVIAPLITLTAIKRLSTADLALLGADDGDSTLADYDITYYSKFSPAQLAILIAPIPKPTVASTATMNLSLLSPHMAAALASSTGSIVSSHGCCSCILYWILSWRSLLLRPPQFLEFPKEL
jgi:hypothetical protein